MIINPQTRWEKDRSCGLLCKKLSMVSASPWCIFLVVQSSNHSGLYYYTTRDIVSSWSEHKASSLILQNSSICCGPILSYSCLSSFSHKLDEACIFSLSNSRLKILRQLQVLALMKSDLTINIENCI